MRSLRIILAMTIVGLGLSMASPAHAVTLFFDETAPATAGYSATGVVPLVGDFNGDHRDDLYLYRAGTAAEQVKFGIENRTFITSTESMFQVNGTFSPFTGDFDGNGVTDIYWYAPGTAADYLWYFEPGGTHRSVTRSVSGTYRPIVADFYRGAAALPKADDIFWYGPGATPDALWYGTGVGTFTSLAQSVPGSPTPIVGYFTPSIVDGWDDVIPQILWYTPGPTADPLWVRIGQPTFQSIPKSIGGTYTPVVDNVDDDQYDDIIWYSPTGSDTVWLHDMAGTIKTAPATIGAGKVAVTGTYLPVNNPVVWWSPNGVDSMWRVQGLTGEFIYVETFDQTDMGAGYLPQVGDFDGDTKTDIYWLKPGSGAERLFWGTFTSVWVPG